MQCPRCQHENPPQAKFCLECGARLALTCAKCQSELPPSAKFCLECGEPVGSRPAAAPRFVSPESYTPKHLAEKILTSKAALEGERKLVTVLFADMKGSMELLADRDPEEARKLLDPVLERMMEAVHRYEGTVNQVMGDGIMALFGAPLAHEDHAVRACYAALRMQDAVGRYSDELRRGQGVDVQIRVGLNSGEVVVRSIGSDLHMDYTAVGQTTHLAGRMEQLARPATSVITGDTLRLAEGSIQVKPIGPVPVKGLADPVEVYELTGAGLARTRFQAAAARGLTRFVGRDAELEQLRRVCKLAGDGHGQVVAIVGEAGVGKSRLFYEFTHSHRTQGWLILESGSVSYGKATSYLPVIDLLKEYFKIQDRDEQREVRERVIGKLLALDEALRPLLPALLALLDVPVEDPHWQALDPAQRRQRTLDALKRLLVRESQVQPLLVIFEDLHWIDTETQAWLDTLIESLPTARLLLLVNYRPEYEHGWGSKTYYTQLRLDALAVESAGELLHMLLGNDVGLAPLRRVLIDNTEGNPFFLEESVRTLVEAKALIGERGAYRLAHPMQTVHVPATVQAVLAARIDRLPSEEKQLLQAASVLGKDVPFVLLQATAELPEGALRRGLTHLQGAEFLYETRLFPDVEYTFKHALTHEVAYGSLLEERRRISHGRIVDAIERLYPYRLAEHAERLGHHAVRGEVWDRAVRYLRQAGTKAFERSANREAVAWFDQALAALKRLPETHAVVEQAIDLRFDLRSALHALGELRRGLDTLREAERLAEALGDPGRLGWAFAHLSLSFLNTGDPDRAIQSAQQAFAVAESMADIGLLAVANHYLGAAYFFRGDYRREMEFHGRTIAALKGDLMLKRFGLHGLPAVFARGYLARSFAELGEFADAIASAEDGVRIAETAEHLYTKTYAETSIGHVYLRKGDLEKAIRILEHDLTVCRAADIRFLFPLVAAGLASAYGLSGRLAEALTLLEQALETSGSLAMPFRPAVVGSLSEVYLAARRIADALVLAGRAFDLSREQKERGYEAWTLRLFGEIHSHRDPPSVGEAEDSYRPAVALATELGMRPLVAHCHLGLGKLYWRMGKRDQAHEHLTTATTMYREMDMGFWLEQAEAEMRELG